KRLAKNCCKLYLSIFWLLCLVVYGTSKMYYLSLSFAFYPLLIQWQNDAIYIYIYIPGKTKYHTLVIPSTSIDNACHMLSPCCLTMHTPEIYSYWRLRTL
ncbi:unnamed protein product, partial [Choristocarpus tenellus]